MEFNGGAFIFILAYPPTLSPEPELLERMMRIELTLSAWKALMLPLHQYRIYSTIVAFTSRRLLNPVKGKFFGTLAIVIMSMRQRYLLVA